MLDNQKKSPAITHSHLSHLEYRPDIDGLRAIAILSVIAFHAFPNSVKGGFVGVDIFFVISGYLISGIIFRNLGKGTFSFAEFYARRIKRIFPALILVLVASFTYGWFALFPNDFQQLGKHIAASTGFVQNFVLWKESGYFDTASESKPLLHLWSLAIEEQYYLIYPLLIWGAWRLRLNILTIVIFLGLLSFGLNVVGIGENAAKTFFLPQTRFWELLAGAVLAHLQLFKEEKRTKWWKRWVFHQPTFRQPLSSTGQGNAALNNILSTLGLLLIIASALSLHKENFPGWWALAPVLGGCLLILTGPNAWINQNILANRMMVFVGLISYPLYLWHWPILSFSYIEHGMALSTDTRIVAIIVSIVLAWLTYKLIEKPIRFGMFSQTKVHWACLSLCLVIGLAGFTTYIEKGFDSIRVLKKPKIIQELYEYKAVGTGVFRYGSCFLDLLVHKISYFSNCKSLTDDNNNLPVLFLWGDSHAAHLQSGYHKSFGADYRINERTVAGCPPLFGVEIAGRPYCGEFYNLALELIKKEKPEKVVIAANWLAYDFSNIGDTVQKLHEIGVMNIDIVGPVPHWLGTLHQSLVSFLESKQVLIVPKRMSHRLYQRFFDVDTNLSNLVKELNANYISPAKIFCNNDGCLTIVGDGIESMTTNDDAHLTIPSAEFLVSKFPKN